MYLGAPLLRPKLEPTKVEVSESGDDPESYALTRVSRPGRKQQGSMYHGDTRKCDSRWGGGLSVPFQRRTENYLHRETLRPIESGLAPTTPGLNVMAVVQASTCDLCVFASLRANDTSGRLEI